MGSANGSTAWRRGSVRLPGVVVLATLALAGGAVGAAAQSGDDTAAPDATMAADPSGADTGSLDGSSLDAIIAEVLGGPDVPDSLQSYWASTFPTFSDKPYHDPDG